MAEKSNLQIPNPNLLYITNINFVKSLYLLRFFLALVYVVFSWCQQQAVQSVKIVLTLEIPAFPVSILLPVHCLTLFQSALQVQFVIFFIFFQKYDFIAQKMSDMFNLYFQMFAI